MIPAQQLDIFRCFLAAHAVADYLKYALKARCRYNMQQLLRHRVAEFVGVPHRLHEFVCVFHLNAHQLIHKIMKTRSVDEDMEIQYPGSEK